MYLILSLLLIFLISTILLLLNTLLMMMKYSDLEKKSPFECGFMPLSNSYLPFSIPFYLMTLMFLIFDVEIILLIPMVIYIYYLNNLLISKMLIILILFLLITLLYEILNNYLKWIY